MNQNKIENPKTPCKESLQMNDKDYLNSILELEKSMSNNTAVVLDEASNGDLYEDIFAMMEDLKDAARECYDLAFRLGWYSLEEAEETKIQEKINCLESELQTLENES
ncbi:MAG: spore coat protein [Bacilli bacterium]|nr:spore coat protein [Bacilli bacterium]